MDRQILPRQRRLRPRRQRRKHSDALRKKVFSQSFRAPLESKHLYHPQSKRRVRGGGNERTGQAATQREGGQVFNGRTRNLLQQVGSRGSDLFRER